MSVSGGQRYVHMIFMCIFEETEIKLSERFDYLNRKYATLRLHEYTFRKGLLDKRFHTLRHRNHRISLSVKRKLDFL